MNLQSGVIYSLWVRLRFVLFSTQVSQNSRFSFVFVAGLPLGRICPLCNAGTEVLSYSTSYTKMHSLFVIQIILNKTWPTTAVVCWNIIQVSGCVLNIGLLFIIQGWSQHWSERSSEFTRAEVTTKIVFQSILWILMTYRVYVLHAHMLFFLKKERGFGYLINWSQINKNRNKSTLRGSSTTIISDNMKMALRQLLEHHFWRYNY